MDLAGLLRLPSWGEEKGEAVGFPPRFSSFASVLVVPSVAKGSFLDGKGLHLF